ncbi:MAG: calycin-like domain-containing protein [Prevotella sp.]|jgi:hypothetical protein|nr:calycin-like domain-containing protein [Prevotella sp.]
MNKKLIYLLMFVFTLGLSFTACGSDDDDDYAKEIAATYAGTLTIPGLSATPITIDKDIALTRTAENKAKVELKDLSIPMNPMDPAVVFPVGTIIVDNIDVSKSGDTYTLKETSTTLKVPSLLGDLVDAGVKVSGTVKDNKLALNINVTNVPVVNTLAITFAGAKK